MLRRALKATGARALSWTGADHLIGLLAASRYRPLVIGYHRVVEDCAEEARHAIPAMLISRRMLERQLDWIGRRYRFVSLDELGAKMESGETFDDAVAAVTFDDGYRDVYQHAFPILQRKGIPAAVFPVTALLGTSQPYIHDVLYAALGRAFASWRNAVADLVRLLDGLRIHPPRREALRMAAGGRFATMTLLLGSLTQVEIQRLVEALETEFVDPGQAQNGRASMTWEMLAEMQREGITIGSHTRTHALLTQEIYQKMLEEAEGSRRELEARLGVPVRHLAYPDGRFNSRVLRAVAASGYRFAYTICRHRDPRHTLLTIPRKILWEQSCLDELGRFSPAIMSCQANGIFDFAGSCREVHA